MDEDVDGEDNTARMALVNVASSLSIVGSWTLRIWLKASLAAWSGRNASGTKLDELGMLLNKRGDVSGLSTDNECRDDEEERGGW